MVKYVNVRNELTGAVGSVSEKLFSSSSFNKNGVWTLYDGDVKADCGCNGQTVPDMDAEGETFGSEIDNEEEDA